MQRIEHMTDIPAMIHGVLELSEEDYKNLTGLRASGSNMPMWKASPPFEDLAIFGFFPFVEKVVTLESFHSTTVERIKGKDKSCTSRWIVAEVRFTYEVCGMKSLVVASLVTACCTGPSSVHPSRRGCKSSKERLLGRLTPNQVASLPRKAFLGRPGSNEVASLPRKAALEDLLRMRLQAFQGTPFCKTCPR